MNGVDDLQDGTLKRGTRHGDDTASYPNWDLGLRSKSITPELWVSESSTTTLPQRK
jgi:hypothetical protein